MSVGLWIKQFDCREIERDGTTIYKWLMSSDRETGLDEV